MKKIILATAILIGLSEYAMAKSKNQEVLNMAHRFDRRIDNAKIYNGDTVVLQGYWPKPGPSFQADFVAGSWCLEFDSSIKYIQLRNMAFKMVGGSACTN